MSGHGPEYEIADVPARLRELERLLQRKNHTFEALFRLFEKLGSTFDAGVIVRLFMMTLAGQLGLGRICFYVRDDMDGFVLYHALGMPESKAPKRLDAGGELVRWIRRNACPAVLDEFPAADGEHGVGAAEAFRRSGCIYACAPGGGSDPVGIVLFGGKITGELFSVFDVELMRMIMDVAAITLRNAFLYQDALRAKAELETFAKVKREFISHTSHELRTPLTVIKSSLWSLDAEDPGNAVLIDMAKDAVMRMQDKVEQVLSLNEMDLSGRSFNLASVELSQIVEDVCREMIPEFEEREITVRVDDRARCREALIDASKMRIAVRSMLDNAVASVERGGFIGVTVGPSEEPPGRSDGVEITSEGAAAEDIVRKGAGEVRSGPPRPRVGGPWLVLRVADNGRGIPSDEIRAICEPFRRASNSAVSDVRGLGLGLSVSQRIIAGHGGRLFCRSESGNGAEFSVWLPL